MKKYYMKPALKMLEFGTTEMIAGSQDIYTDMGGSNIGYGGVDEGGTIEPAAREYNGMWDEE